MVVELDRDPAVYPDGNIVEVRTFASSCRIPLSDPILVFQWPWAQGQQNPIMDGFTIRRTGDVPTKIRIVLYLEHFPQQFKVAPELGNQHELLPNLSL